VKKNIKFETIGNATIICYDDKPVLVTDPWFDGNPYFGSWSLSHEIPEQQQFAINTSEYIWISHGHPDHLISDSINHLKHKKILLPDHYGKRIFHGLSEQGFNVKIIKDKEWTNISENIKIMCLCDFNQDAVLLIDINGRLIINMNDCVAYGWSKYIRNIVKKYNISFYLRLYAGYADMCNFFDEDGRQINVFESSPVGSYISKDTDYWGAKYFIPFSSFHQMARIDSAWLNKHLIDPNEYQIGYQSDKSEILSPFIQYDCIKDDWKPLEPKRQKKELVDPREYGDIWSDELEGDEYRMAKYYFQSIEHLYGFIDFINLKVGSKDNIIEFKGKKFNKGITFEAPRNSLVTAINYEVFDDMMIGNFMKTTLHGNWSEDRLYPNITPYIAKYGDNGKAKTKENLEEYFREYRKRYGIQGIIDLFQHKIELKTKNIYRDYLPRDSWFYQKSKMLYYKMRSKAF